MSEGGRTGRVLVVVSAGAVIGVVEVVLAISFAAFVFGGYLEQFLPAGIGIYLIAAALTLAILAWRAGARGVVGSVQDAAVAVLAIVAASAALDAYGSINRAFLTVVAATLVVTLLTATDVPAARHVPARQPRAVHPVSGRRRLPRRHRLAADEGRLRVAVGHRAADGDDRASTWTTSSWSAWVPAFAVRCHPADRDPGREAAAGDPARARPRARGVRDRAARDRDLDPGGARRAVAARAVHEDEPAASCGPWTRSPAPTGRRSSIRPPGSPPRCSSP